MLLAVSLIICYEQLLASTPLPLKVIDTDKSGKVSLFEALNANDIGEFTYTSGCTEYY